ncbi:MAG: phosphate acyltransferase PlsX [Porticoccaceae bacterium]
MTRIAVDLQGGDLGSPLFVYGVLETLEQQPDIQVVLLGDIEHQIPGKFAHRIEFIQTTEVVDSRESPASALRNKGNSSMAKAIRLLAEKQVDAVVSAGNTGALVGFGVQILGVSEGVSRPAIGTAVPTHIGKTWMLDVGATLKDSAERLIELARIGAALSRVSERVEKPRVSLLNVGSEAIKGTPEHKVAASRLQDMTDLEFSGYVEGDGIFNGRQDVVVCDGYTGNIAIKTAQGLSRLLQEELNSAYKSSLLTRVAMGLIRPSVKKFARRVNPSLYNGAPLLGLNGLIVKSHGSADQQAFANAVQVAADMAKNRLVAAVNADVRG